MIIGKFQLQGNVYHGLIPAFTDLQVAIQPTDQKGVEYAVTVADGIELGVGWTKTSSKGNGKRGQSCGFALFASIPAVRSMVET